MKTMIDENQGKNYILRILKVVKTEIDVFSIILTVTGSRVMWSPTALATHTRMRTKAVEGDT